MVPVPEDFIKSAVFISVEDQSPSGVVQRLPKATAFLVSVPIEGTTGHVGYFVTARHCLLEARAERHDSIYLRLNRKDTDEFEEFPTKLDDWYYSDNADVAAIPFVPAHLLGSRSYFEFDIRAFNMNFFVGPAPEYQFTGRLQDGSLKTLRPLTGSEIYHIGLFTQHYGKQKNLPVARFGHISRMPSLLDFEDPDGTMYESAAYLAEFHSWGGHSGSPVYFLEPQTFISIEIDENDQETGRVLTDYGYFSGFLGMVSGHYNIESKAKVTGELGTVEVNHNSGIATVIPAEAIRLLLTRDDFVTQRKTLRAEMEAKSHTPTMDYGGTSTATFQKDDFDNALRRLSRRRIHAEPD